MEIYIPKRSRTKGSIQMYWFILLFPLMIYPWGYDPYYTFPKTAYLQIFILCTWLYVFIKRKKVLNKFIENKILPEKLLLLLSILIGVSTLLSIDRIISIFGYADRMEGLLTYYSYFSIFLFSTLLLDEKKLNKIIPGIVMISIIPSIYGILQHYSIDFMPRNSRKLFEIRSYSFFDNANFFGTYLVLIIMLGITMYLTANIIKMEIIYLSAITFAFIALIFSQTRSGLVGLFCGCLFLTIFIFKRKYLWRKWIILMTILGFLIVIINLAENGTYGNRINSIVSDSYKVLSDQTTGFEGSFRIFLWTNSIPLIDNYFWFGSGPDTFAFVLPEDVQEATGARFDKAHNEYLQIAITLGVPALIIYLLFVIVLLRQAFRALMLANENEKIILYGLISAVFGYLIQAFFNISVVPVAPLFWALLGITLVKSRIIINKIEMQDQKNVQLDLKIKNQCS